MCAQVEADLFLVSSNIYTCHCIPFFARLLTTGPPLSYVGGFSFRSVTLLRCIPATPLSITLSLSLHRRNGLLKIVPSLPESDRVKSREGAR